MIRIQNPEYFAKVCEFASRTGQLKHLFDQLHFLGNRFGRKEEGAVVLSKDFAPASFALDWIDATGRAYMNGGLIYHGDQTAWGEASPTFSVLIGAVDNPWQVHT